MEDGRVAWSVLPRQGRTAVREAIGRVLLLVVKNLGLKMRILLGYVASLILTFVVTAMTITAFLSFTGSNTHPRFQRLSSEHNFVLSNKRGDHLRAARGTKA